MPDDESAAVHEGRKVSASRVIDAPAGKIFDLLADPRRHGEIDGSGTVRGSVSGPERLELGSKFGMKMKIAAIPYRISSKVVEFDEDRLIAWCHFGRHRWRWELEPIDENRTRVTETFDYSTAVVPKAIELMGYPRSHGPNIEKSLDRLAEVMASS